MAGNTYNFSAFTPQGVQAPLTVGGAFNNVLSDMLGAALPPQMAGLVSGVAGDFITKIAGLKGDILLGMPLTTGGMTSYGASQYLTAQHARMAAASAFSAQQQQQRINFFEHYARLRTSEDSYIRKHGSSAGYNEFIRNEALGLADNRIASTLIDVLDPYDMNTGYQYMAMAGSNLAVRGARDGHRDRIAQMKSFMSHMFTDDKGKFSFNKADYGGMGFGEVGALTAALTKELDPIGKETNPDRIRKASKDFSERVKEYAQSLAPLKDVFGKDMANMLQSIESLTGHSVSNLSLQRIRQLSSALTSGLSSGRYTMADIQGIQNQAIGQLIKFGASDAALEDAGLLSIDIANMGTRTTGRLNKARLLQHAYDQNVQVAGSSGAEYLNRAYAMGRDRGLWASPEDFRKRFGNITDPQQLLSSVMSSVGVSTLSELESGLRSKHYDEALDLGIGRRMGANSVQLNAVRTGIGALAAGNRDLADVFSVMQDMLGDSDVDLASTDDTTITAIMSRAESSGRKFSRKHVSDAVRLFRNSGSLSGAARDTVKNYALYRNAVEADRRLHRDEKERVMLDALFQGDFAPSNLKEAFMQFFDSGGSFDKLKGTLVKQGLASTGAFKDLELINKAFGEDKDGLEEVTKYAFSGEGLNNLHFRNALRAGDKEAMIAFSKVSSASVDSVAAKVSDKAAFMEGLKKAKDPKAYLEHHALADAFKTAGVSLSAEQRKRVDANDDGMVTLLEAGAFVDTLEDKGAQDKMRSAINQARQLMQPTAGAGDKYGLLPLLQPLLTKFTTAVDGFASAAGNLSKTVQDKGQQESNKGTKNTEAYKMSRL